MKPAFLSLLAALGFPGLGAAAPARTRKLEDRDQTTVTTPQGNIIGTSAGGVESFAGIPFAQPPVGPLRLKPPVKLNSTLGDFDASGIGPSCPQMYFSTNGMDLLISVLGNLSNNPIFQTVTDQTEDCLTMRVQRPAGTASDAKLPVLFWIFGGAFELGSTQTYDGTSLVLNGVDQDKPFIYVAVNYRVGGFGFLPGKEILADGASNLGLLDQRMGLEWVADNIEAFGGDPEKVTIWGESAGAISVFDQMALYGGDNKYNGKPLFRGAIMNSGSIVPADAVDCDKGQVVYDTVVAAANCSGTSDTLACLREADYDTFLAATNSVPGVVGYSSVALSYVPRPDGTALTKSPDELALNGEYAAVPMIIGDLEDEGTLFSLMQPNLTTSADVVDYLNELFFNGATADQLTALVNTYDPDIAAGSPFRTGLLNDVYPQFKLLAAILGDLVFTLTRRLFLQTTLAAHPDVPAWSYLASYDHGTPVLGTFHASDLLQVFYGILPNFASRAFQTYYLSFLYNLDPNDGTSDDFPDWPQWGDNNELMWINSDHGELLADDFRQESAEYLRNNVGILHV